MTYDIFSSKAPQMPATTKATEFVKLVLSCTSKSMQQPLLPMIFPAVSAHLKNVKFEYNDTNHYELCGQMGHLIGNSGVGKAQLTHLIEAVMRSFRQHDEVEYQKLGEWQRQVKTPLKKMSVLLAIFPFAKSFSLFGLHRVLLAIFGFLFRRKASFLQQWIERNGQQAVVLADSPMPFPGAHSRGGKRNRRKAEGNRKRNMEPVEVRR